MLDQINAYKPESTNHLIIQSSKSGQAMVEFIIGLVAVLALTAALLQIASLTKASTETMFEARKLAGEAAVSDMPTISSPDYIRDWQEGPDQRQITPDDSFSTGNGFAFADTVLDKTVESADQWDLIDQIPVYGPFNDLQAFAANPSMGFGLVHGSDSQTVPLLKAVQQLIYDSETIEVKTDVWMTWTKGIY